MTCLKVKAIDKLRIAHEVRDQTVEDGQRVAEAMLYAEAKLGELLKPLANPTASREGRRQLPEGITHKQSHEAQLLEETISDLFKKYQKK